jgi:hypothetical protein
LRPIDPENNHLISGLDPKLGVIEVLFQLHERRAGVANQCK